MVAAEMIFPPQEADAPLCHPLLTPLFNSLCRFFLLICEVSKEFKDQKINVSSLRTFFWHEYYCYNTTPKRQLNGKRLKTHLLLRDFFVSSVAPSFSFSSSSCYFIITGCHFCNVSLKIHLILSMRYSAFAEVSWCRSDFRVLRRVGIRERSWKKMINMMMFVTFGLLF